MLFNRLKISTRIYVGFSLLVVPSLVIAAFGYSGIDGLGRQSLRMNALSGNLRYVATAVENEELTARLLLRIVFDPADDNTKTRVHDALDKVREAMIGARTNTSSPVRDGIYQSTLDKLDAQTRSADKSVEMGRDMLAARSRLFAGGDILTDMTAKLVDAARASDGTAEDVAATVRVDRAVLLARIAAWRFLATGDKAGAGVYRANIEAATAALDKASTLPNLASTAAAVHAALTAYDDAFKATSSLLISLTDTYKSEQRPMVNGMIADLAKAAATLDHDTTDAAAISAELRASTAKTQITVAGLGLICGLALAFFIAGGIVRPLRGMTSTMATLAAGNRQVSIPGAERTDEIGDMARAVDVFKINMIKAERLAAEQEAARAARSRRQDAMDEHTQVFGASVTSVMSALSGAAGNMREAAGVMTEAAAAVHSEASATASGAGKSSADLTAVAAAVEQFTASVGEISRQVAVASEVAAHAVQRAGSSQATIRRLADSTARIGDVVRLIDTIASQTNLLALNATIEAARAGDAGKGFAVVAGEVKALAAQTAKATAEISGQIETVRGATDDTVNAMNEIGGIIGRMGEVSTAISAAVEEQSATTREIASSIQGVAGSTAQTVQAMEHVVRVADQAGGASRNILTDAADVGAEADKLRLQVEAFLEAVRTDSGERRRFERIAGNGVSVTLTVPGGAPVTAVLNDLSRTGVALLYRGKVEAGLDVQVDLPDAGGPVTGRVVRSADGILGIAFSETPTMLARVEKALASLTGTRTAA